MFCSRYDHHTKKEANIRVLPPRMQGRQRCSSQTRLWCCVCMYLCLAKVSLTFTGSNQAYRAISTSQLNTLQRLHLWPIDEVVYLGSQGYLVLKGASRLDAFSGYPVRSSLLCTAAGATTDPPVDRSPRSSRTRGNSSQVSYTHGR